MKAVANEAVLFFGKKGICREMLYSEFEAVLDGVVGIPDFADMEVQACYVSVTPRLHAKACVLFLIEFDDQGQADRDWNIPLRHLAENAGPGPDMGEGPVRLACRTQCSVAWYQKELWEPSARQGLNHFALIRDALKKNRLAIKEEKPETSGGIVDDGVPVLEPLVQVGDNAHRTLKDKLAQAEKLVEQMKSRESMLRTQIIEVASEYKDKFQKLDELRKQDIEQLKRVMRNEAQAARQQLSDLELQLSQEKVRNDSLTGKYNKLSNEYSELKNTQSEYKDDIRSLKKELRSAQQAEAEVSPELEEKLQRLEEQNARLQQEKEELILRTVAGSDENRVPAEDVTQFVAQLQERELVFVAYHPGAGHMTLPCRVLLDYMEDPVVYVAQKCSVSVDHYRSWLKHYEKPVCGACETPVSRVDSPKDFVDGNHNYCSLHKKNSNVAPFRRTS